MAQPLNYEYAFRQHFPQVRPHEMSAALRDPDQMAYTFPVIRVKRSGDAYRVWTNFSPPWPEEFHWTVLSDLPGVAFSLAFSLPGHPFDPDDEEYRIFGWSIAPDRGGVDVTLSIAASYTSDRSVFPRGFVGVEEEFAFASDVAHRHLERLAEWFDSRA